jgi:hypothetical protein
LSSAALICTLFDLSHPGELGELASFSVKNKEAPSDSDAGPALAQNPNAGLDETLKQKPSWKLSFSLRRWDSFLNR